VAARRAADPFPPHRFFASTACGHYPSRHDPGIEAWTLPYFLNLVAYSVVLYLLAGLLYPVRGADVIDFRAHFEANRPRFFTMLLTFQAVDFVDALLERKALGLDWAPLHLISLVLFSTAFVAAIRTSNRTYQGTLAIAWLLTCLFWGISGFREPIVAP